METFSGVKPEKLRITLSTTAQAADLMILDRQIVMSQDYYLKNIVPLFSLKGQPSNNREYKTLFLKVSLAVAWAMSPRHSQGKMEKLSFNVRNVVKFIRSGNKIGQGDLAQTSSQTSVQMIRSKGHDGAKTRTGGIDLTQINDLVKTQHNGSEIKFHMDPAMLKKLQNASGFVPVIISIEPMRNLRQFLGVQESMPVMAGSV